MPTHSEYTLSNDDGTVTINSLEYPVLPAEIRTTDLVVDSAYNHSLIPSNYHANLTYRSECSTLIGPHPSLPPSLWKI